MHQLNATYNFAVLKKASRIATGFDSFAASASGLLLFFTVKFYFKPSISQDFFREKLERNTAFLF